MTDRLAPIDAANLKGAHRRVEIGTMRGKSVVEGWSPRRGSDAATVC